MPAIMQIREQGWELPGKCLKHKVYRAPEVLVHAALVMIGKCSSRS
jgi:hypothetical protein